MLLLTGMFSTRHMSRLFVILAFAASMHGLLHAHALGGSLVDHQTAPQNCALCVSAQSALPVAHAQLVPPNVFESAPLTPGTPATCAVFAGTLSSRAPPLV